MSSKTKCAKWVETHWRYANAPKKFRLWFAKSEWKRRKNGPYRPPAHGTQRTTFERDARFNRILRRYGLNDLQIIHPSWGSHTEENRARWRETGRI